MSARICGMLAALGALVFPAAAGAAAEIDLPTLVRESPTIIFAQVTNIRNDIIQTSVVETIKGEVSGSVDIGYFEDREWRPGSAYRDFKKGEDYIFFLGEKLIGNVPFAPHRRSIDIPVNGRMARGNVVAPARIDYWTSLDLELVRGYLRQLVKLQRGDATEIEFAGMVQERLAALLVTPGRAAEVASYLQMMIDINCTECLPQLRQALENRDPLIRGTLLRSLFVLPRDEANTAALRFLRDPDPLVLSLAARAVMQLETPGAVPVLAEVMKSAPITGAERSFLDPDRLFANPRQTVVKALVNIEGPEPIEIVKSELRRNDPVNFRLILHVFREYNDDSLNLLLLELLQNRDFFPRQAAILDYFYDIRTQDTIDSLLLIYNDRQISEAIRRGIIDVLDNFVVRAPETVPKVLDFLVTTIREESDLIKEAGVRALGNTRHERAVDPIEQGYREQRRRPMRQAFIEALSKVESPRALEALRRLRAQEKDGQLQRALDFAIKKNKFLAQ